MRPTGLATQIQEELPVPQVVVREFQVAIGACRACGRRVQGRHRLQTSDALGAAGVQLGPQVVAATVILNKQLGLSFGKVATLLRQHYGLTVSRSGLVHSVHRAARQAQPTYVALQQQLRRSPVVTPDETGWKVAGRLKWLWAVATPQTTVYAIQPGRGYPQAASLLGEDFAGVIVRDGWAPYRQFTAATHQSCLAHLLRRCRTLQTDHPHSRVVTAIQTALQHALDLRTRHHAGTLSAAGVARALEALAADLAWRVTHPGPLAAVQRFAAHLTTEWPALFTFLRHPQAVDATNWRAEQAIRPAVVTRKDAPTCQERVGTPPRAELDLKWSGHKLMEDGGASPAGGRVLGTRIADANSRRHRLSSRDRFSVQRRGSLCSRRVKALRASSACLFTIGEEWALRWPSPAAPLQSAAGLAVVGPCPPRAVEGP